MIAIIDYGAGNLFSVKNALDYLGVACRITAEPEEIRRADEIILPGVGAFPDAMRMLREKGLEALLKQQAGEKPFLGICLGMQMLFETGYEFEKTEGLGLIPGSVVPLKKRPGFKIPHMGWNSLKFVRQSPLYKYLEQGEYVYFVHSYYGTGCAESTTAVSGYGGIDITASVECGNVFGTQFHPEKSGAAGLKILRAFGELGC